MKQIFISILLAGSLAAGTIIAQNTAKIKQIYKDGAVEFYISVAEIDSIIFTQVETNNAVMHIMRDNVVLFQSATADIDSIVYYLPEIPVESIELSNTSLFLIAGETYTLTATNATNKIVTWTSDNENVATVDVNGKVTAVSVGTATITAQAGNETATCTITVYDRYNDIGVEIAGIIWATRNVDMPGTFVPTPESPGMFYQWNRRIGWSSTDPRVNSNGGTAWSSSSPSGIYWIRANDPCPTGWRVPTDVELHSLNNAEHIWTTHDGVNGRLFGIAPYQIFLPAAGHRITSGTLSSVGTMGRYWSSSRNPNGTSWLLSFGGAGISVSSFNRANGFSVRCVWDTPVSSVSLSHTSLSLFPGETQTLIATVRFPENATNQTVTWTSDDENIATVDVNGKVTAVSVGTATITAQAGEVTATCEVTVKNVPADGVLINGIVWANRNVDAPGTFVENPESAGMFYQWNRRVGWSSTNPMVNSSGGSIWNNSTPTGSFWARANDPCPTGWRVPTGAELGSLNSAGSTWIENWNDTGVNGRLFGTAPNQIFLPAAGWRYLTDGALSHIGTYGDYWSSTQHGSANAQTLRLRSSSSSVVNIGQANGSSVRCVADSME